MYQVMDCFPEGEAEGYNTEAFASKKNVITLYLRNLYRAGAPLAWVAPDGGRWHSGGLPSVKKVCVANVHLPNGLPASGKGPSRIGGHKVPKVQGPQGPSYSASSHEAVPVRQSTLGYNRTAENTQRYSVVADSATFFCEIARHLY